MKLIEKKLCRKCSEIKNLEDFGVDNLAIDGRRRWCKECRNKSERTHNKGSLRMDKLCEKITSMENNQKTIMLFLQTLKLSNSVVKKEMGKTEAIKPIPACDKFPIKGLSEDDLRFLNLNG